MLPIPAILSIVGFLANRAKEPSSSAGLAAIAQAFKQFLPEWGVVFDGLTMALGGIAVILAERAKKEPQ